MKSILQTILQTIVAFTLPVTLYAATDCRVVELSDRFEAICVGDERYAAEARASSQHVNQAVKQPQITGNPTGNPGAVRGLSQDGSALSQAGSERPRSMPAAVKKLVDYRQHKLQRADVEAKKAVRMELIKAGRQNQSAAPQSQSIDDM